MVQSCKFQPAKLVMTMQSDEDWDGGYDQWEEPISAGLYRRQQRKAARRNRYQDTRRKRKVAARKAGMTLKQWMEPLSWLR